MPPEHFLLKRLLAVCVVLSAANLRADVEEPAGSTSTNGATVATSQPTDNGKADVRLNFHGAPVADVLHYYEALSGKKVIYDATVSGWISVQADRVTRSHAAELIEDAMREQGYIALHAPDGTMVKFLSLGTSIAKSGPVASRGFRLQYIDEGTALKAFADHQAPSSKVTYAVNKPGYVLVSGQRDVLDDLARVLHEIDVPPGQAGNQTGTATP